MPNSVCADVTSLPFTSNAFDLCIASDVLCHVPPTARHQAVAELMRVGSRVLLMIPGPAIADEPTPEPVIHQLEHAGWHVDTHRVDLHLPMLERYRLAGEYPVWLIHGVRG